MLKTNINTSKPTIEKILVVEGKTDTQRLQKLFNVITFETGGMALNKQKLLMISKFQNTHGVILLLDPDGPGEAIRQQIIDHLKQCENVYLNKKDMREGTTKIGVAEATDQALLNAFNNIICFEKSPVESLTWNDYLKLQLNSKSQREIIIKHYQLGFCNHKRLFKYLNLLNVDYNQLCQVLKCQN